MWLLVVSKAVPSIFVKLETSCTVILFPKVSVLWFRYTRPQTVYDFSLKYTSLPHINILKHTEYLSQRFCQLQIVQKCNVLPCLQTASQNIFEILRVTVDPSLRPGVLICVRSSLRVRFR